MAYHGVTLEKVLNIGKIYSIHYFEYMNDFYFKGETHDFWEFVCVDKGEVSITAGSTLHTLKKGDIAFHQPNEFHNVKATGTIAPNLVVISFDCDDEAMSWFRGRILSIDETERILLANIINEARRCFDCRLDDPYLQNMPMKASDLFGSEQLILVHLTYFLIHLLRRYANPVFVQKHFPKADMPKTTRRKNDVAAFYRVADYLKANLNTHLTVEKICRDNLIGRSRLQKLFKENCKMGIIEYFSWLKIDAAKEMIRTNRMNFTQISEYLGYTSVHYFSRQFKQVTGMTPSEYASSIKAMADGSF